MRDDEPKALLRMLPDKLTAAEIKTASELVHRISQCERVPGSNKRRPAAIAAWQTFLVAHPDACLGGLDMRDELEALLESISTANPALRVHGVVKTPSIEGKLSAEGKVLPGGVAELELPPPLLGQPKKVRLLRPTVTPVLIPPRPGAPVEAPIYLDNPNIGEKAKREYYAVLLQIPWLHKRIRTAIRRYGLEQSVEQNEQEGYRFQTAIYRNDIARYKAAFKWAGERKYAEAAFEKLSEQAGISVDALKKRLQRKPRA